MATCRYIQSRRCWLVRWQCTVKHGPSVGEIIRGSKTFKKKLVATEFCKHISEQEEMWAAGINISNLSIPHAVELWQKHIAKFTARTQQLYGDTLPRFIQSLPSTVSLVHEITPRHIHQYLDELQNTGVSFRYCDIHLEVIRSFTAFCTDRFEIENVGLRVKKREKGDRTQRFLTDEEYDKSLTVAEGDNKDLLVFFANTGLRAQELCDLGPEDVRDGGKALSVLGKGRKRRTVPLNRTSQDILNRHLNRGHEYIFVSARKKKLKPGNIHHRFSNLAKKAKIPIFGPHAARHYFATALLLKGVSIQLVSQVLGHESIKTTEKIYKHILPKHLDGLTDVLE